MDILAAADQEFDPGAAIAYFDEFVAGFGAEMRHVDAGDRVACEDTQKGARRKAQQPFAGTQHRQRALLTDYIEQDFARIFAAFFHSSSNPERFDKRPDDGRAVRCCHPVLARLAELTPNLPAKLRLFLTVERGHGHKRENEKSSVFSASEGDGYGSDQTDRQ